MTPLTFEIVLTDLAYIISNLRRKDGLISENVERFQGTCFKTARRITEMVLLTCRVCVNLGARV